MNNQQKIKALEQFKLVVHGFGAFCTEQGLRRRIYEGFN